jgi:hypothetical protein
MTFLKPLALGLSLWAMAAPASAAMVTAQDPQSIVSALQQAGYVAKLDKDPGGDPMILSAASGANFRIFFFNCTANKDCSTIQFYAGYDVDEPIAVDRINAFNQTKRFIRALVDKENDPVLVMDLNLDKGGMSDALFIDNLEVWATQVPEFQRQIGLRK